MLGRNPEFAPAHGQYIAKRFGTAGVIAAAASSSVIVPIKGSAYWNVMTQGTQAGTVAYAYVRLPDVDDSQSATDSAVHLLTIPSNTYSVYPGTPAANTTLTANTTGPAVALTPTTFGVLNAGFTHLQITITNGSGSTPMTVTICDVLGMHNGD